MSNVVSCRTMNVWKQWPLINTLAESLGVAKKTRQQWYFRRSVPHYQRLQILARARRRRKRLSPKAFENGSGK